MINLKQIIYSQIEPEFKEVGWLHKINDVLVLSFYDNGEWKYTSSGITEELLNAISTSVGLDSKTKIYTNTGQYIGKLVVNTVTSDIKALDTQTKSNTDNITTLQTSVIEAKTEVKGQIDKIDVVSSIDTDGHTIYTIQLDPNFLAIINGIPEQTNDIIDGQLNTGGTIDIAIKNKASLFNTGLLGSLTVSSVDPTPGKNGYYAYTDSGTNAHGIIDSGDTLLVTYDSSVYTYTLIKKDNNVNIEYAKNNTQSTIGRGKLIYISGSTGGNPLLLLATNTDYNIAIRTWGMTYDGINAGAVGRVIHFGLIENLDTSAYTAGTELWLGVNGEFTNVRPTLPTAQIYIGMVICSSATVGSIFIDLRHVPKLTSLSDVKEEIYTEGDVPVFNETNRRFEKQNIVSEVGISDYEEYNPSITYEIGAFRTYQGKLYKCISNIIFPEEFNNSNWTKTSINEIITNSLSKKLDSSKIIVLSEEEYAALATKEEGEIYFIYS